MNIVEEFKKASPINLKQIQLISYKDKARITKAGRLFDITDKNDDYLLIETATLKNGKRIITVRKTDKDTEFAAKSSTVSTGAPFIDARKLCLSWFGNDPNNWIKKLKLLKTIDGIDYYEVVEK